MPRSIPYQPVLLRILHGGSALLVILALISGFWVYNIYDGRWGSLPLPNLSDTQDIHGTIAVTFLLLLPIFALYSFHIGYHRLIQEQAFNPLKQVGKPVWWIFMHRLANTFMLLAATFAVITGRMMEEEWLPAGEINRPWYLAHLVSWLIVFLSLALHLLLAAKVGGVPLLQSMLQFSRRDRDTPKSWLRGLRKISSSRLFQGVEIMVMGGIILAFLLPVFAS
ncbi:cytochrome b/b6 domain-containing protein [Roseofilum sp. BLCC_M154]|uniref:Cytochrome b/b6 domain-containing protein n=1 Tax=Roseofilum acuticapitatum BLCC-M154 TaxID=3022444 RepID=A0ABT7ANH9_9CYAN|nr:cytochrome b/b6 domain-containing protein [Roseofilum acuticapitatum]MDJ1168447.1 cytochrome b/b6 domain-containing protein [Roseofilum acuticapitatum BLCC-M154]